MLKTKREWMVILESVEGRFYDSTSDEQQEAFAEYRKRKFPNARGLPDTVDELRTYVYLMISFAYEERIVW